MSCSITRRRFVTSVLGAAGVLAAIEHARGAVLLSDGVEFTCFDSRFVRAQVLARELADGGVLRPVGGDPTELVSWIESCAMLGQRYRVQGITVESVPFCLKQFEPRADLLLRRIDRDLFAWTVSPTALA